MNGANPLSLLLDLGRRARAAGSDDELAFLAVNDTRVLAAYRQAGLWFADGGLRSLSGVVQIESNAPYAQWLARVCAWLHAQAFGPGPVSAADLPEALAGEWGDWLPQHGFWLPFGHSPDSDAGGLLLAADDPWTNAEMIPAGALLGEWITTWSHAWQARRPVSGWSARRLVRAACGMLGPNPAVPWWRRPRLLAALAVLAILLFPVRLSILAPGELVPANPAVVRAPLDGVLGQFHVRPNELVKAGQPLFGFDEAPLSARLDVAAQALATSEAEYRQFAQQALSDGKSKAQLAILLGRIEEKRAEAEYLRGQLERARVVAPRDGIALFDDPGEWIGRPVQTGERIMRIAAPGDVEVEAWIPIADAIPLPDAGPVDLYLAARPLSPLDARIRYFAHESVQRPDGSFAYRLRATLGGVSPERVGLKGTAKIHGERVPLAYWMLRRPLATIRQTLGI